MRIDRADEDGAILVIVVVSMIAILGMAMLVIDVGALLLTHRKIVQSADSAALSAALECANPAGGGSATTTATDYANKNMNPIAVNNLSVTSTGSCHTDANGSVDVAFNSLQNLYFAPALGFRKSVTLNGKATAIWGPAGQTRNVIPMVSSRKAFFPGSGCEVPRVPGSTCYLWYSADDISGSNFGWLDLGDGWNVPVNYSCNNSGGAKDVSGQLDTGVSNLKSLNWPQATYDCSLNGNVASNWNKLGAISTGTRTVTFAVNDPPPGPYYSETHGGIAPYGDVPGASGGYKYDIIGFVNVRLIHLYSKSDPDWPSIIGNAGNPGTPNQSGTCVHQQNLTGTAAAPQALNLVSFAEAGCPNGVIPDTITPSTPNFVYTQNNQNPPVKTNITPVCTSYPPAAPSGCKYYWSSTTPTSLIWTGGSVQKVNIAFTWFKAGIPPTPATSGLCGNHFTALLDPNSYCLKVVWDGFSSRGGSPGHGADFGIRAVKLTK